MNNFLLLPDDSKRFVVEQTALREGLSKQVVEKDLWVSNLSLKEVRLSVRSGD